MSSQPACLLLLRDCTYSRKSQGQATAQSSSVLLVLQMTADPRRHRVLFASILAKYLSHLSHLLCHTLDAGIVDSLENITHSLCTLEFESRRASYFWWEGREAWAASAAAAAAGPVLLCLYCSGQGP